MLLGDSHFTIIAGSGKIALKFTFEKVVILIDVLRTLEMKKNLLLCYLINKVNFTQTIGTNLYPIIKNNIFIRKWYAINGMFKLNVEINKISSFA